MASSIKRGSYFQVKKCHGPEQNPLKTIPVVSTTTVGELKAQAS